MPNVSQISTVLRLGFSSKRRLSNGLHFVARSYSTSDPPKQPSGPLKNYTKLVEQGRLQHDPYQEKVVSAFENLFGRLEHFEKQMEDYHVRLAEWEKKREEERRKLMVEEAEKKEDDGMWASVNKHGQKLLGRWVLGRRQMNVEPGVGKWVSYLNRERKLDSIVGSRPAVPPAPKGLYIYGNVGCGKTMLMDMFYGATDGIIRHGQRFHFHEAMLKINEQMHKYWKENGAEKPTQYSISSWIMNLPVDEKVKEWLAGEEFYKQQLQMKHILPAVADKFLVDQQSSKKGASILCFDEIQTVDVFAIVALSGIMSRLLTTGTVLVATSNRAPRELNQDGMQKEIFDKFISKLEKHCEIISIGSEVDYRRVAAKNSVENVHYLWPLNDAVLEEFEKMWRQVTDQYGGEITSATLPVMFGRTVEVPESCSGVARFTFEYLCGRPVGAADYIAVAKNYHTIFISDIPAMSMEIRDKARRFITLVDELYNHHCCLVSSAETAIDELFQGTAEGTLFDLESFQFETETEDSRLRRDVLAEGSISAAGSPSSIVSMLSGEEEMFAFARAASRLIEMQTPLYLEGVRFLHPYFHQQK
ncbi:putative ATPase, AFG1, P-loop containing nucleoside triphosphate hydrolase [Arabidopsis thaliana]|uniref:AFG1-like ATPase family protein n=2 Tax=Arabidopsis TaxID=3701 RepID=A0A178VVB2_ARATH|nr:ATPase AFG1-like [Arabidopsis thaliana x Arabidopsis arenosa]OAP09746.1 hypothetical protein AXX17_AT2G21320 [Arabidopsis thaliana]